MPRIPSYLSQEIATIGRDITIPMYGGNRLYPQDETLISRGGGGWMAYDIYTDLAKDTHAYAVLQKRYMEVVGREWEVKAASEDEIDIKAADLVRYQLENLATRSDLVEDGEQIITTGGGFDSACWGLLNAILYGFYPAELMWGQDSKEVFLDEIRLKDLRRFGFVAAERGHKLRLMTWDNPFDGIAIPPRKFIVHRFASLPTEDPYGLGIGTRLFYPVYFKRNAVKFWLVFADKWATPTAVVRHPRNATQTQRDRYLEMLSAIASDAGIAIPEDVVVEFLEAQRSGTIDTYRGLVDFCNSEMSKCVLGETGSTDQGGSGGSRSRDEVGERVRIAMAKSDSDLLSETLNRTLIPWIVQLNMPDARPPKVWRKFPELESKLDRAGEASIISMLVQSEYRPTRKWVSERLEVELEEPQPEQQATDPEAPPDLGGLFGNTGVEPAPGEQVAEEEPELSEVEFGSIIDRVIQWNGLSIGVEYLPGQVRFPGRKHSKKLRSGYGHIRNHKGADGEALDCYLFSGLFRDINDDEPSNKVFEVTQLTQDGEFDEHKFMIGFANKAEAEAAYLREMPEFLFGGIREVAILDLEQYRNFSETLDFRAGTAKKAQRTCKKGYSCGYTCIAKGRQCKSQLNQQANAYANYLESQIKQLQAQLAALSAPKPPQPGAVAEVDPSAILADPKRFQYKLLGEHTATGEVGSLSGVKKFDRNLAGVIQAWIDPADGKTYVVNGHNRLALAKRLGADKVTVRYLDVKDAQEARAVGALTNIAEGRGNAVDAAKFFKDSGLTKDDLDRKGIPMREKIATDGIALSKLDDSLFRKVIDGEIPTERAVIIGGSGLDHQQQRSLVKLVDDQSKKRKITNEVLTELVDTVKASQQQTTTQFDLFGASQAVVDNTLERASLQAAIKKRLGREKKLFGTVGKSTAAQQLAQAGNVIDVASSQKVSKDASATLSVFDQLKNQSGGISKAINDAANQIQQGGDRKKVETDLYKQILQMVQTGNFSEEEE